VVLSVLKGRDLEGDRGNFERELRERCQGTVISGSNRIENGKRTCAREVSVFLSGSGS
jgi:hypothetical protein